MASPSDFTAEQYTPTAITQARPVHVTIAGSNFSDGDRIRFTKMSGPSPVPALDAYNTGMVELNDNLYVVRYPTADEFDLYDIYGAPIDGRTFSAFNNIGVAQVTLTGPLLDVQNLA